MIRLIKTRRGCAMLETTPRYDVEFRGQIVGQLYYNCRGYVGGLPCPDGGNVSIGERPISEYRREVARLNREWKAVTV